MKGARSSPLAAVPLAALALLGAGGCSPDGGGAHDGRGARRPPPDRAATGVEAPPAPAGPEPLTGAQARRLLQATVRASPGALVDDRGAFVRVGLPDGSTLFFETDERAGELVTRASVLRVTREEAGVLLPRARGAGADARALDVLALEDGAHLCVSRVHRQAIEAEPFVRDLGELLAEAARLRRSMQQGSTPQGSTPQGSTPQGSTPQGSTPQGSTQAPASEP